MPEFLSRTTHHCFRSKQLLLDQKLNILVILRRSKEHKISSVVCSKRDYIARGSILFFPLSSLHKQRGWCWRSTHKMQIPNVVGLGQSWFQAITKKYKIKTNRRKQA